jgi:hypothetical protein
MGGDDRVASHRGWVTALSLTDCPKSTDDLRGIATYFGQLLDNGLPTISQLIDFLGVPYRIRTGVAAVRE